jgi:hypothetical protein
MRARVAHQQDREQETDHGERGACDHDRVAGGEL